MICVWQVAKFGGHSLNRIQLFGERVFSNRLMKKLNFPTSWLVNYLPSDYLEKPLRSDYEAKTFRLPGITMVIRESLANDYAATVINQQSEVSLRLRFKVNSFNTIYRE